MADADGTVDLGQRDVEDRRGMPAAAEDVEIGQLAHPFEVADAAIDDESGPGPRVDRRTEIVANEGAVLDLAEEIDDEDVAGKKRVDDPSVLPADMAIGRALRCDDRLKVVPQRDHADGDRPADEHAFGMQIDPAALVLEVVATIALDNDPRLVVHDPPHPDQ